MVLLNTNLKIAIQYFATCHVPRPKVVAGMSSRNHFRKESSPFSAAVELDCLPNVISLPVSQYKYILDFFHMVLKNTNHPYHTIWYITSYMTIRIVPTILLLFRSSIF